VYDKDPMSDLQNISDAILQADEVTVGALFEDLARAEADEVLARIDELPTDVMLLEGAGALIDAAASLRYVAARLARPGSTEAARLLELSDKLTNQAARFQHAGDSAAVAIRAAGRRHRADA
jgi:hypothetical protein